MEKTNKSPDAKRWYKVLVDGKSCHGGHATWSLPDGDKPGKWLRVEGGLSMCSRGIHLTEDPVSWFKASCKIYEAEPDEVVCHDTGESKALCRGARLLREITDVAELADLRIFVDGEHSVTAGKAVALGSSSVEALGSSSVVARDSSQAKAFGDVTLIVFRGAVTIEELGDNAVLVDRRATRPAVTIAGETKAVA